MSALAVFGIAVLTAVMLLVIVWLIQLFTRNAGLVDVVWSAAVGVIALEYSLAGNAPVAARLLMAVLAITWSFRLAGYLALRMKGQPEDSRYAAARESWGAKADLYMLGFFALQAVIAAVLSIPFLVIATMDNAPSILTGALAVVVWFVSVVGEGVADAQLKAFKSRPKTRARSAGRGSGTTRATRTISSSRCTGSPTSCWRSARATGGRR